jgi:hypothetical protein
MPKIELDGGPHDPARIRAFMSFPNDQVLRELYFFLAGINDAAYRVNEDDVVNISGKARTWRLLLHRPNLRQLATAETESVKRGQVAGDVLAALYLMDRFSEREPSFKEPSMRKAVFAAQEMARTDTYGDGTRMKVAGKTIEEYWEEFKPVAHLWAAFRINNTPEYSFAAMSDLMTSGFVPFLQVAAGLFHFGCDFKLSRVNPQAQKPILDPRQSWSLPDSIERRDLDTNAPLPSRLVEILRQYKAFKS